MRIAARPARAHSTPAFVAGAMLSFALLGVPIASDAAPPASKDAANAALFEAANQNFAALEASYAKELGDKLNNPNAFMRLLALRRLRALPDLVTDAMLPRMVELASDTLPLAPDLACLQGTTCLATSNAEQARGALAALPPERIAPVLISRVLAMPQSAADLAPLAEQVFGDRASDLLPALKQARSIEQQAALLLIGAELDCAANDVDVSFIKPFLVSQSELVKVRAALVVLKRSDACEHAAAPSQVGARAQAVAVLNAALEREQPPTLLDDLTRIGTTASPLLPTLLRKLSAPTKPVIAAIAAMKFRARPAAKSLAGLLDEAQHAPLAADVLRALSAIRPSPETVRSAVFRAVQRSALVLPEASRVLADIEAPTSPSEFEFLSRLYRSQCKPDPTQCAGLAKSLAAVASRSNHSFEPL